MGILSLIGLIVVVSWLLGIGFHLAGNIIHVLIIVAVILFLLDWSRNRSRY